MPGDESDGKGGKAVEKLSEDGEGSILAEDEACGGDGGGANPDPGDEPARGGECDEGGAVID